MHSPTPAASSCGNGLRFLPTFAVIPPSARINVSVPILLLGSQVRSKYDLSTTRRPYPPDGTAYWRVHPADLVAGSVQQSPSFQIQTPAHGGYCPDPDGTSASPCRLRQSAPHAYRRAQAQVSVAAGAVDVAAPTNATAVGGGVGDRTERWQWSVIRWYDSPASDVVSGMADGTAAAS